jgi:cell division protease FtsH
LNQRSNQFRTLCVFIAFFVVAWFVSDLFTTTTYTSITRAQFEEQLSNGEIREIVINQNEQVPTGVAYIVCKDSSVEQYNVSDVNALQEELQSAGVDYSMEDISSVGSYVMQLAPILISVVMLVVFMSFMRGTSSGNMHMMNFGKSRARMTNTSDIDFSKVAGLEEEKGDLEELVDFLKNPQKYTALGARIPKGVILEGPPGTGKTLLAKAVAGEAHVPFFSISGSDFVEMFVGVGASRVRDLFTDAKKNAPCIIFIDEIDAVGRRRGSGLGGSHDEREQTLNQLLVEMDGFSVNEGIIVMAATNRPDILDPAILRPGRFDRKISVGRPDVKGREEILKVHSKDKPLKDDVDLKRVAKTTAGFTGADLENLLNEAAILTAREGNKAIGQSEIDASFIKVGIGSEKKSKVMTERDKKITAYHEAGHAILFHDLPMMDPVHTVSIIPTSSGAAGFTMPLPSSDDMFNTKEKMLENIQVALGGRIAEEIIFGDVTTGASQDIKQATAIAKSMVMQYGMSSKVGLVNYGNEGDEIFIGRDFGQTKSYGEHMATIIDEEVKNIIDDCYKKARNIIESRRNILDKACRLLLEKERITGDEFDALFSDADQSVNNEEQKNHASDEASAVNTEAEAPETADNGQKTQKKSFEEVVREAAAEHKQDA